MQEFREELRLPDERAERSVHLTEKLHDDTITRVEFLELSANVLVRREQAVNEAVNNYGVKPFLGLEHLDGSTSVNDLLRNQFASVESKDDVIEASQAAQEEGVIFVSQRGIVMFHAADVNVSEDGSFDIEPQVRGEATEENGEAESAEEAASIDAKSAFA